MDKGVILGVDIGGSHVSAALVNIADGSIENASVYKQAVNAQAGTEEIIDEWAKAFTFSLSKTPLSGLRGIGISMPGPFDYDSGVSLIRGVNKYDNLYGLNIKEQLQAKLGLDSDLPIHFENDGVCFALGASRAEQAAGFKKIIAITLGTGLGASFIEQGIVRKQGTGVPPEGWLYHVPFLEGIAEDYLSTKWLVGQYNGLRGTKLSEARQVYELAVFQNDPIALALFDEFGKNLGLFLSPWIKAFEAECLVIGGNLTKARSLFLPELKRVFESKQVAVMLRMADATELLAITGAATLCQRETARKKATGPDPDWRKTTQPLLPLAAPRTELPKTGYDLYPYQALGKGKIFRGYASLAQWIGTQGLVLIDGYAGVDWSRIEEECNRYFQQQNISVRWWRAAACQKPEATIAQLVQAFLGAPGSVWGKKTTLLLDDFFESSVWQSLEPDPASAVNIVIGCGAALCGWEAPVVYIDLPKNELQYRMRAGSITNLGCREIMSPAEMYKRFYFVDWVVLNAHRKAIKNRIAVVADGQWRDDLSWAFYGSIQEGLQHLSCNCIRVRPWFEAGAWGGQWMKQQIPSLNQNEVNYAWSFELIVPENGIVFESDGTLLELCFDWLMEHDQQAVLGKDAQRFGTEFPIRFDFLDTFDGGNLSIQCHPSLDYIREEFGESITQDETYYILDCKEDAKVYLGFQEGIDAGEFRTVLESSQASTVEVDIEKYVQTFPSKKHDLFLIPNGTIHSSGKNNLVLEISATPYIFTFKMYDWLRLDLNGEPRPINIEHAFRNLNFERKGKKVGEELISKPAIIEEKEDYQLVHLPTHPDHFYDVHRVEFITQVTIATGNQCHVLMLVEGEQVLVKTENGEKKLFHYAETFILPAAAGSYTLMNPGTSRLKVIKAFIK